MSRAAATCASANYVRAKSLRTMRANWLGPGETCVTGAWLPPARLPFGWSWSGRVSLGTSHHSARRPSPLRHPSWHRARADSKCMGQAGWWGQLRGRQSRGTSCAAITCPGARQCAISRRWSPDTPGGLKPPGFSGDGGGSPRRSRRKAGPRPGDGCLPHRGAWGARRPPVPAERPASTRRSGCSPRERRTGARPPRSRLARGKRPRAVFAPRPAEPASAPARWLQPQRRTAWGKPQRRAAGSSPLLSPAISSAA